MTLISEEYRRLNRELHSAREDYGTSGQRWAQQIVELCQITSSKTLLDYGCGKGTLRKALIGSGLIVSEYDPAVEGKDSPPTPAEVVACTDVLEHIEPGCLSGVLEDLRRVARKAIFLSVATRPAVKKLKDGRNAHLIVEDHKWWLPRLFDLFEPVVIQFTPGEFYMVAR